MNDLRKRPSLEDDQEKAQEAYELLCALAQSHPEIEPTLWAAASWTAIVDSYIDAGASHKEFVQELDDIGKHYAKYFDK